VAGEQALTELLEVSEDVTAAVLFDRDGEALASAPASESASEAAQTASAMLAYVDSLRTGASAERIEAVTEAGNVYAVREGERAVVAVTGPEAVAGLVFHDLRAALRKVSGRKRPRAKAAS